MKSNVTVCGIPVKISSTPELTIIQPRWGQLTPIQSKLIAGWLEHRGNVTQVEPNAIRVAGQLAAGSLVVTTGENKVQDDR